MSDQGDLRLGGYAAAVDARLAKWQEEGFGRRLWEKDHQLWSPEPIPELTDRLGWLGLPVGMTAEADRLSRLAREMAEEEIRDAVVLGMGGSSLAPEVFAHTFSPAFRQPAVSVLDSTHPDAVRALAARIDPARSVFVVSSKSGTTTETLSFFQYFWELLAKVPDRGRHFVAVTDPGTPLEKLARERGFRAVFNAPSDVGGRYSALTPFGLVPAALLGVNIGQLLARARGMAEACGPEEEVAANPGLRLGAALGELALAGRDKVTFITSHFLESFPEWIEQLIAESTGKTTLAGGQQRGIVPVAGEPLGPPEAYGDDRFFAALLLKGDDVSAIEERLHVLEAAGHPVGRFWLSDRYDLGAEMFRWEMATAAAGAVLQVNPFDEGGTGPGGWTGGERGRSEGPRGRAPRMAERRQARGLPRAPCLSRSQPPHERGAAGDPGGPAREHAPRGHAGLRPAVPAFDGAAPQGRLGPLPLPATGGRAVGGPRRPRDLLHLRHPDPGPGGRRPPGAGAAGA
jgi:transaldolase/glucose-6-phosphate isomerase